MWVNQSVLELWPIWCPDHFSVERDPVTIHPLGKEPIPNVQPVLPLRKLQSLSLCPVTVYQREEISHSSSAALLEGAVGCNGTTPQPLFFKLNEPSNLSCFFSVLSWGILPNLLLWECCPPSHPQFVHTPRIIISQMQNPALALVQFNMIAQLCSLPRALSKAFLSSREFTVPPHLVWSAKWLNLHLAAASRSFIKVLKHYLTSHLLFYFQYLK